MISVKNISKKYGQIEVLKDINFDIHKGEIVGFLGVNGAGKTTLMRILTSFLPATEGEATVAGFDVHKDHKKVRANIGYLPENPPLYQDMDVLKYLKFAARLKNLSGKNLRERVEYVIERCQLNNVVDRRIHVLSKGFKQRVGLAQAILNDPKVLILDEPTTGLDPIQVEQVRGLLNELKEDHTVILSTHVLSEIERVAHRVLILKDGVIAVDRQLIDLLNVSESLEETFIKLHS